MRDDSDRELEALLDAALTGYARMEQEDEAAARVQARTMAEVRGSGASSWKRRAAWGLWALPIATALVLAAVMLPGMLSSRHSGERVLRGTEAGVVAERAPAPTGVPREAKVRRVAVSPRRERGTARHRDEPEALPKLDVFPTPRPLTPEQVAFMKFAAEDPKQAAQAISLPDPQPIAPLTIAAIEIQPLEASSKDPNP